MESLSLPSTSRLVQYRLIIAPGGIEH
jgi:hypothetical protein